MNKIISLFTVLLFTVIFNVQASDDWPRQFKNADGTITNIPAKPERIVSTTVTTTGTLLAIDAPVVASSAAANGKFFSQWDNMAKLKKVNALWAAGSPDLEMVYGEAPDLIVVSATGADSVKDLVAELNQIAPTIIIDYSNQSWQSLAIQLGGALGIEENATKSINEFNSFLAKVKQNITLPSKKINIVSYQGAGAINAIAQPYGAHATLLSQLGFEVEAPKDEWSAAPSRHKDFLRVHFEAITQLNAETTFLLAADQSRAIEFIADPVLANVPSVVNQQVYGLGRSSFRIDRFSAVEILSQIHENFSTIKD